MLFVAIAGLCAFMAGALTSTVLLDFVMRELSKDTVGRALTAGGLLALAAANVAVGLQ